MSCESSLALETEADELCQVKRYERSADRLDRRAGCYRGKQMTKAGEVDLKVPYLRRLPFEKQIIELSSELRSGREKRSGFKRFHRK